MPTPVIAGITQEMETLLHSIARYTRFVRSTKVMLGIFACLLTCLILFYPLIKKDTGTRIALTSTGGKGPSSDAKMLNARFHGLDKNNQPYNVTSRMAIQLDEDTVGLDRPTGDIALQSGGWFSVSANDGVFKMKEKALDLKGSVELFDGQGYEFRTERMHIDVEPKTATTRALVKGQGPLGTLRAEGGADIDSDRQTVLFMGPVFVTMYPSQSAKTVNEKGREGHGKD